MNQNHINNLMSGESTGLMPVLFVGHGSPMNAIEENEFVSSWRKLGKSLPLPKAILCISAHWETNGTFVTAMQNHLQYTILEDFRRNSIRVQYPAPGSPELASEIKEQSTSGGNRSRSEMGARSWRLECHKKYLSCWQMSLYLK